jgi:hypothetical protein
LAHTPFCEFLKRRYAAAIERADDRTATRLRAELDRLLDGPPPSGPRVGQVVDLGSRSAARRSRLRPLDDILDDHDDILGSHL